MSQIQLDANVSKSIIDRGMVPKDHPQAMAYCKSNGTSLKYKMAE